MNVHAVIRLLACIAFLFFCLQGTLLSSLGAHSMVDVGMINNGANINTQHNILDETVRLLFMGNDTAAHDYLKDHPSRDFKFYVHHHLLPEDVPTVESISECIETWGYNSERYAYPTREEFLETFCDWSETICNPKNHTRGSQYSTARLNNNMDAVIARLFLSYGGDLRTFNITEATIKVVPFPQISDGRCVMAKKGPRQVAIKQQETKKLLSDRLKIFVDDNQMHLHDHLFLFMSDQSLTVDRLPSYHPGQLVVPYVNTNAEYQPDKLISNMNPVELDRFFSEKRYALAAVFAAKISGNGYARKEFAEKADSYFGNGTLLHNNGTLAGMPVEIIVIQERRKMVGEAHTMQLYRESIFCPSFRGDTPDQKRFFDAILSGCIPVVMAHYWNDDDKNKTSYFAPAKNAALSNVYPWAKGSFGQKYPNMGIDYSELVIEINEKDCGLDCLPTTLERWLKDPAALREKQKQLAKFARLFSFGMKDNAFQYVDAMAALLVRTRHYVLHEAPL